MGPAGPAGPRDQEGAAAIAYVVAAALSLVVFVSLANAVTMGFSRHAVRVAVDEAVRVGARSDRAVPDCEARAATVLRSLLGRSVREGVAVACSAGGDPPTVRARADVVLTPWWPGLPHWAFSVEAASPREVLP